MKAEARAPAGGGGGGKAPVAVRQHSAAHIHDINRALVEEKPSAADILRQAERMQRLFVLQGRGVVAQNMLGEYVADPEMATKRRKVLDAEGSKWLKEESYASFPIPDGALLPPPLTLT